MHLSTNVLRLKMKREMLLLIEEHDVIFSGSNLDNIIIYTIHMNAITQSGRIWLVLSPHLGRTLAPSAN